MVGDVEAHWPADRVERWPIDELVPYARNARLHSAEQITQVAGSIKAFGWTIPVLCAEDGTIIAGHGRVLAAKQLGIDSVPVMVARGWSDAQRRAYTLADNRLAENASWDDALLAVELAELMDTEVPVALAGFSADELHAMFNGWQHDPKKTDVDPGLAAMPATIKVKCLAVDKAEVERLIVAALTGRGFEQLSIE